MPTVSLARDRLFDLVGKTYTKDEFDELCFEFGLELDDVTEEDGVVYYKVEVPANRYDLLCAEGVAQALAVFIGTQTPPQYTLSAQPTIELKVSSGVSDVRPYIVCAVLRDLNLDAESYQSLIDLQEKLHHNICRRRTLVAIGTHDLDTIETPLSYDALNAQETKFVALRQTEEFDSRTLLDLYKNDPNLKQYVHMLDDKENFPYVRDASGTVLSMPPIINSEHSKISVNTKNMLIECTATDKTKAYIVLNILVSMFSRYCANKYHAETVRITYPDGTVDVTPKFEDAEITANTDYINTSIGIGISPEDMCKHLAKMQVPAEVLDDKKHVKVKVPVVRPDLLHACDIMCDVAIGYGFNKIPEKMPESHTVGKQQPLNHLADLVRRDACAQAGYTEVLTWVTVSHAENFELLRRQDDGKTAVVLGNPKTVEFEECRTSLLPGLLKTLRENRKCKIPIKLFEVGDTVVKNGQAEVGAVNRRKIAAIYCNSNAGFEIIQGLLEHIMTTVGVVKSDWHINPNSCTDQAFFDGRKADVVYKQKTIGTVGWIHPQVLNNFKLTYPCSALEIDLECFL